MKSYYFRILTLILIIITFNSCYSENIYDPNKLINLLNKSYNYDIKIQDLIVKKTDDYIYTTKVNSGVLLTLFCNQENEITQCTITTFNENNKNYLKICKDVSEIIIDINFDNYEKVFSEIKNNKSYQKNGWQISIINNDVGITYIINRYNNDLNFHQFPSLKEEINEKDISRPKSYNNLDNILP